MPFPEKEAPEAENATQPGAQETAAPAPGSAEGEANEQVNMAAIGQALKHIAGLLENILAKVGGAAQPMDTAGADSDLNEADTLENEREGAMDGMEAGEHDEISQDPDVAEDADLVGMVPAISGENEGNLEAGNPNQEGAYPMPKQATQEGTPARGNATPHGAMDAKSVRTAINNAVAAALKTERARAAAVERAKHDVQGVLGPVHGMDSASAIYREALAQVGMDVASIAKGAERAAWDAYKLAAGRAAGVRAQADMALDSKTVEASQSRVLGHLSRISVKG